MNKYKFISRENIELTEEIKTIIAGNYVMLTFGMNRYLTYKFNKILVYPDSYVSLITKKEHLGEYNSQLKLIVFSWENFLSGIKMENDCYNLGIHEFTHAILEEARDYNSDNRTTSFNDFENGFDEIKKLFGNPNYYETLKNSNFFRDYAFTNHEEFISVIMEYFFESPQEFHNNFPKLFSIVKKMINYQESWFQN